MIWGLKEFISIGLTNKIESKEERIEHSIFGGNHNPNIFLMVKRSSHAPCRIITDGTLLHGQTISIMTMVFGVQEVDYNLQMNPRKELN